MTGIDLTGHAILVDLVITNIICYETQQFFLEDEKVVEFGNEDSGDDLPIFSFDIDEHENNMPLSDDMLAEIPQIEEKEENVFHTESVLVKRK